MKMYNGGIIIVGLIIFVGLMTYPIWSSIGSPGPAPELELTEMAKEAKVCVESKEYMAGYHMELLHEWRYEVVRNAVRNYTNSEGKTFNMSLQNTCMECHSNKDKFCDRCHDYASVRPICWDCHLEPKGKEE